MMDGASSLTPSSPGGVMPSNIQQATCNPMRWARKPWRHLGLFTREEAVDLLAQRFVSQKRRVQMRGCVRIIYYCHVQRSSGCRYEMSVCIPNKTEEKLRIDDYNVHTCNLDESRQKRRAKPQIEDFNRPFEKKRSQTTQSPPAIPNDLYTLGESVVNLLQGLERPQSQSLSDHSELNNVTSPLTATSSTNDNLACLFSNSILDTRGKFIWKEVDIDVLDFSNRPDGQNKFVFHTTDKGSHYSYASPLISCEADVVSEALLTMLYQFGCPTTIYVDLQYKNSNLESLIHEAFPDLHIIYHLQRRNQANNIIIQRRENILIKERILAWMMEKRTSAWAKYLPAIKYSHNTEYLDELGSTPMNLFFARSQNQPDGTLEDDSLSDTSNDLKYNRSPYHES